MIQGRSGWWQGSESNKKTRPAARGRKKSKVQKNNSTVIHFSLVSRILQWYYMFNGNNTISVLYTYAYLGTSTVGIVSFHLNIFTESPVLYMIILVFSISLHHTTCTA
jgi:hypothetical protein